jgi:hypothetical protein
LYISITLNAKSNRAFSFFFSYFFYSAVSNYKWCFDTYEIKTILVSNGVKDEQKNKKERLLFAASLYKILL